jgi:hypothetical protein
MPNQLTLGIGRKTFLRCGIVVAAFGVLSVPGAKAQNTTWTITINATSADNTPTYSVDYSPPTGGCKYAKPGQVPTNLNVCLGDTVTWKANTKPGSAGGEKSEMFVIHEDAVIFKNGAATRSFHAKDGNSDGGVIPSPITASLGSHEYYVFVLDKVTQQVYVDDPKIIIGTGSDDLNRQCHQISEQLPADSPAEATAKKLCKEIRELENRIHSQ